MKHKLFWTILAAAYAGVLAAVVLWAVPRRPAPDLPPPSPAATAHSIPPPAPDPSLKPGRDRFGPEVLGETSPEAASGSPAEPPPPPRAVRDLCSTCHNPPSPRILTKGLWPSILKEMSRITRERNVPSSPEIEKLAYDYFLACSPEAFPKLPPDPASSGIRFQIQPIGNPMEKRSMVTNVNVVDLDRDGRSDVLVCDAETNDVRWIHLESGHWKESRLSRVPAPVHTEVFDADADGDLDVIVAALGMMDATDEQFGGVCLLVNEGNGRFAPLLLAKYLPRVADVQPADLDGDGDIDFAVGMFGWQNTGGVAWLERLASGEYAFHVLSKKSGTIHVPTADLNGDGRTDFVALTAQEHEEIVAYLNRGGGQFDALILFKAEHPLYGSSGIQLVDLDLDGDMDVLYSNGDHQEFGATPLMPYFGVQWLENLGGLSFLHHHLLHFYGSYRAVAGDLDSDGDVDVVAASMFNDWTDPARQSLIWLENDGRQQFIPHGITNDPTRIGTISLGDLDGDGRLDIVGGCMHFVGSKDREGRVTWFRNDGPVDQ